MQHFVKSKRQPDNKDKIKDKRGKERAKQKKFSPCTYRKKITYVEKNCWKRPDVVCNNYKQLRHNSKLFKYKNKECSNNQQAQAVKATKHEQFFAASCSHNTTNNNTWLIDGGYIHHMTFNASLFRGIDELILVFHCTN